MNVSQAFKLVAALSESQRLKLLEQWPRSSEIVHGAPYQYIGRGGVSFGASYKLGDEKSRHRALHHAMALAIAAGEMEIDSVLR